MYASCVTGGCSRCDSPQSLFEAPVNLFVAGFIGSPSMNFVNAELVRDDGPAVTFAGFKLKVPPGVMEAKHGLADYLGRKVILGIRPSDFEDASLSDRQWGTMGVTAGVTEELGSDINVMFTIDAPLGTAREHRGGDRGHRGRGRGHGGAGRRQITVDRAGLGKESRVRHGAPLELSVDTRYLQFFDPASGLSIGHPKASAALAD